MDFKDKKLEIEYPCHWDYKVIGFNEKSVSAAVLSILEFKKYALEVSNKSTGGKYVSFTLSVVVESDQDRTQLHNKLSSHVDIKYVL
jgi:putative lipoic acid-binding regulatory protein